MGHAKEPATGRQGSEEPHLSGNNKTQSCIDAIQREISLTTRSNYWVVFSIVGLFDRRTVENAVITMNENHPEKKNPLAAIVAKEIASMPKAEETTEDALEIPENLVE